MDAKRAFALIDSYALDDCAALLKLCAPDLHADLADMIRRGCDEQTGLASARAMVRQAYLREDN